MESDLKIIVLAGSRQEFERYLADNGLTDSEAVYGYSPERVQGIRASEVVTYGTFWDRNDASKLWDLANTRIRLGPERKSHKDLLDRFYNLYREGRTKEKAPQNYVDFFKAEHFLLIEVDKIEQGIAEEAIDRYQKELRKLQGDHLHNGHFTDEAKDNVLKYYHRNG